MPQYHQTHESRQSEDTVGEQQVEPHRDFVTILGTQLSFCFTLRYRWYGEVKQENNRISPKWFMRIT